MIVLKRNNPRVATNIPKGLQFLGLKHVEDGDIVLKITEVTTDEPDNFGNPLVVYFEDRNGSAYSKGWIPTSDTLAHLCEMFTKDETKWAGRFVTVGKATDRKGGMRLTFAEYKEKKVGK